MASLDLRLASANYRILHKPKPVSKRFFALLGVVGIVLILLGGGYSAYRRTILSFQLTPPSASSDNADVERKSLPTKISFGRIKLVQELSSTQITDGVWQIPSDKAAFLGNSARPGENGNIVIYGHNKRVIFGPLISVQVGDDVEVNTEDGESHLYKVTSIVRVKPDRVDLVLPTPEEELTVYTCVGFLDSERLVLKAKPV